MSLNDALDFDFINRQLSGTLRLDHRWDTLDGRARGHAVPHAA
jgi:hypothetical protein